MASTPSKRAPRKAAAPAPGDDRVPVVIRAGHTHRDVHYAVDTSYRATPAEVELLQRFGALVEAR